MKIEIRKDLLGTVEYAVLKPENAKEKTALAKISKATFINIDINDRNGLLSGDGIKVDIKINIK